MNNHICRICGEGYGYVITHNGQEMLICKSHYDYLESIKHSIIDQMLDLTNRKTGE